MKKTILMMCLFTLINSIAFSQASEIVDNKKVVELSKEKLGDDIIIGVIESSQTNFTCGINAILQLKKDSVSEKVIQVIMKHCNSSKITKIDERNKNNPLEKHPSGIYLYTTEDTAKILKKLYPNVITQEKSGGFGHLIAKGLTSGLINSAKKAQINGANANVKCIGSTEFYFYFVAGSTDMSLAEAPNNNPNSNVNINNTGISLSNNWWFTKAISPNEFTLIKLDENRKNREFKIGKSNDYATSVGVDEKQKISFTFEELQNGIFKVKTNEPLGEGEYCFFYSSAVPQAQTNDKVFDFSVQPSPKKK
jgi:hypothetical protein